MIVCIKKQKLYLKFFNKDIYKNIVASLVMGMGIIVIKNSNLGMITEFLISFFIGGLIYILGLFFMKETIVIKIIEKMKRIKKEYYSG